jgi:D-arabinose 1-dehydrogenase-like Zn-dependent alcohol dehydrogenase
LEIPIAGTYGLDQVQDAFRELEKRHTRGKIVSGHEVGGGRER